MTPQQSAECRERSYLVPESNDNHAGGRGIVPTGATGITRFDTYYGGNIPAGTQVRALHYSNAGFRGIDVYAVILTGDRAGDRVQMSAGNLNADGEIS